jgi:hypothetical protein
MGEGPPGRRRPGARREPRVARRLRLHQGPRRAGPGRDEGRRPGQHRAAVDHRIGLGRAPARMDPRLPDGRAGDHLVRPWPPQGVPRGPRRAPSTSSPSTSWSPRSSPSPPPAPSTSRPRPASRSPRWRPVASTRSSTAPSSTTSVAGSSPTRSTTRRDNRSSSRNGRSPGGVACRPSSPARSSCSRGPRRCSRRLPLRGKQAEWSGDPRDQAHRGRARPRVRRAVRPVHRVRGDLPGRQPDDALGARSTRPTGRSSAFDPRVVDWPTYVTRVHLPSVVEHARVKTTPGPSRGDRSHHPAPASQVLDPETARRRVRSGEHPHRLERGRELLVVRDPAPRHPRTRDLVRAPDPGRGPRAVQARPARPHRTSSATSTDGTRTRPVEPDRDPTCASCSRT